MSMNRPVLVALAGSALHDWGCQTITDWLSIVLWPLPHCNHASVEVTSTLHVRQLLSMPLL